MNIHFSDYFSVAPEALEDYGAFDISLVNDLPLFVDPFLLFNSDNPVYEQLHEDIIDYMRFLKRIALDEEVPEPLPTWTTKYATRDEESTTMGSKKNLYEQAFISTHTVHEFGDAKAKYGETIGVVPFDMAAPYDSMPHNTLKVVMSDHRPIWAKFRIDLVDDD